MTLMAAILTAEVFLSMPEGSETLSGPQLLAQRSPGNTEQAAVIMWAFGKP